MKKYFKLVPAALALMAMTSCSNDLFTNEAPTAQVPQEGDLVVENETLEWDADKASTRSYLSADLKVRMYTTNDAIKAFDDELNKYDIYAFSWNDPSAETAGVFRRHNTATNLDGEPRWAIYPDVDGQEGHWAYNKETNNTLVTLSSTLQATYTPDGTYQKSDTKFENPLYKDMLPRWGEVTATEGGSALNTSLKYLTGVLRLQLNGAPQYANAAKVKVMDGTTALKINGKFTTTLAINDVMQTAEFKAEASTALGDDAIIVGIPSSTDLKNVDAMKSVVFIPLPTTNHSVDIVVEYYNATVTADGTVDETTLVAANLLDTETFANKTIKRAKVYGHTTALNFATDATNASGVSDAIELEEVAEDKDLILKANKSIDITTGDNIIYIPNKKCQSITVNLSKGITTSTTSPLIVKYKDVEGEGKYKNPVTIVTGATAGAIDVQLDETPFELVQKNGKLFGAANIDANALVLTGAVEGTATEYTGITLSDNVEKLTIAADASFGDVTSKKLTDIYVTANGQITGVIGADGNPVNANVVVDEEGKAKAIYTNGTVTASGKAVIDGIVKAKGNIEVSEEANASSCVITSTDGNVTISSLLETAVTYANTVKAPKGEVAISGNNAVTGVITAKTFSVTEGATTKDVNVSGDATIDIDEEGVAVSGTLTYKANGKLNLFNGYVYVVDANSKTVDLYHGEEAGFTAIATLNNGAKFSAKNASKWNGAQPAYGNFEADAYNLTGTDVWTATQLGYQLTTAASFDLQSDIDLDNKDWKGINTTAAITIDGSGHTISNINLVNQNFGSWNGAGFIANTTQNVTISNAIFDEVKTTITQLPATASLQAVGAVIGNDQAGPTGTVDLYNVDVKLAKAYIGSNGVYNKDAQNIGGVIGWTNAKTTFTGVTADINGATLAGWHSIGGFIGAATNDAKFLTIPALGTASAKACAVTGLTKVSITKVDVNETFNNDKNQGKVGYYIGTADLSKALDIEDAADVNPTITLSGADLTKAFEIVGAKMNTYNAGVQNLIGQSGLGAGLTGTATINGKVYAVHYTDAATTPNNVLYKIVVTDHH